MKIVLFIIYYFLRILTCVFFCHKEIKYHKICLDTSVDSKKYHQRSIRSKLKLHYNSYPGNSIIFVYFSWHPLRIWSQVCTFYCPLQEEEEHSSS